MQITVPATSLSSDEKAISVSKGIQIVLEIRSNTGEQKKKEWMSKSRFSITDIPTKIQFLLLDKQSGIKN